MFYGKKERGAEPRGRESRKTRGGYAVVFLAEGLTGKLPSMKTLTRAANVGFYILISLVVFLIIIDITTIINNITIS